MVLSATPPDTLSQRKKKVFSQILDAFSTVLNRFEEAEEKLGLVTDTGSTAEIIVLLKVCF